MIGQGKLLLVVHSDFMAIRAALCKFLGLLKTLPDMSGPGRAEAARKRRTVSAPSEVSERRYNAGANLTGLRALPHCREEEQTATYRGRFGTTSSPGGCSTADVLQDTVNRRAPAWRAGLSELQLLVAGHHGKARGGAGR